MRSLQNKELMKIIKNFFEMKTQQDPIVMLTAYDYISAKICEKSGIDIILVGDSLGMVFQGNKSTLSVTIEDMIYHGKAVRKGASETFLLVDMPYMSYHLDIKTSKANAARIMIETEANALKIEGGSSSRIDVIKALIDCEIPVVAHLGLTPQSINLLGEYKVQGKDSESQEEIIEKALLLESAGAFMLVLECVPEELGRKITEQLKIPVIGIGAGRYTDGQVLVWHDLLGLSEISPKFSKQYADVNNVISKAIDSYSKEVKNGIFPDNKNVYSR